jgi:hypothetical protein
MATMPKFAYHSSHTANDDLLRGSEALTLGQDRFICIRDSKSVMVELW